MYFRNRYRMAVYQGRIGLLFQAGSLPSIQATRCVAADPESARGEKLVFFFSKKDGFTQLLQLCDSNYNNTIRLTCTLSI